MAQRAKPISPHLQIYRFTLSMFMSISQRATGIAQYAGTLLLVLWLLAAAIGGGFFDGVNALFASWFGQLVLFGYTWSLFHHALGGIRYFIWDRRKMMDPAGRELLVRLQIGGSVLLTLGAWALWVWR